MDPLGWVTGTQCLLDAICWHPFKSNWAARDNVCHCGKLALQAVWAQTLPTLLLKLQTYPQIKSHYSTFMEHLVCCLLSIFS